MSDGLKKTRQLIMSHHESFWIELSSFFNRDLRLEGRVSLITSDILGGNEPRVIPEGDLGAARTGNNMRRGNCLYIDKIQANAPSTYPVGLSTVETPSQRFVAFQVSFATGQTARAHSFGLCLCYLRGLFAVRARRSWGSALLAFGGRRLVVRLR